MTPETPANHELRQPADIQYLELVRHILEHGVFKDDRTGTGTMSIFGYQMRFDLAHRFPILTTKKVNFKAVTHELLWFLKGETNIAYLQENSVHIWNEWADKNGELGPIYGYQWRSWPGPDGQTHDQIAQVIHQIKEDPDSRRHLVSAWNVADLEQMALTPCHTLFQFYVAEGRLSCQMHQRSADVFLGLPFNIASYALLTHMVAQVTHLKPGHLVITLGDAHLYLNHLHQAATQLKRSPKPEIAQVILNPQIQDINDFRFSDIHLENYHPHPHIPAPISV